MARFRRATRRDYCISPEPVARNGPADSQSAPITGAMSRKCTSEGAYRKIGIPLPTRYPSLTIRPYYGTRRQMGGRAGGAWAVNPYRRNPRAIAAGRMDLPPHFDSGSRPAMWKPDRFNLGLRGAGRAAKHRAFDDARPPRFNKTCAPRRCANTFVSLRPRLSSGRPRKAQSARLRNAHIWPRARHQEAPPLP